MNEHVTSARQKRAPTQAAEGLPRWRWTSAELETLAATGIFDGREDFELIGGEIVPMSPAGRRHELVSERLELALRRQESDDVRVFGERQINLSEDTYVKPDVFLRPGSISTPDLRGDTVILLVEVADSSLGFDTTTKASLYAANGVREYWVVQAWSLKTTVHRAPDRTAAKYTSIVEVPASETLTVALAPQFTVRLADLEI